MNRFYELFSILQDSLEEAIKINGMVIVQDLNIEPLRIYNCLLSVDAIQEAIIKYKNKAKLSLFT